MQEFETWGMNSFYYEMITAPNNYFYLIEDYLVSLNYLVFCSDETMNSYMWLLERKREIKMHKLFWAALQKQCMCIKHFMVLNVSYKQH